MKKTKPIKRKEHFGLANWYETAVQYIFSGKRTAPAIHQKISCSDDKRITISMNISEAMTAKRELSQAINLALGSIIYSIDGAIARCGLYAQVYSFPELDHKLIKSGFEPMGKITERIDKAVVIDMLLQLRLEMVAKKDISSDIFEPEVRSLADDLSKGDWKVNKLTSRIEGYQKQVKQTQLKLIKSLISTLEQGYLGRAEDKARNADGELSKVEARAFGDDAGSISRVISSLKDLIGEDNE
jgi:hypothetical protein